jgi:imidazolonepropionase-like amidohydrolase
LTRDTLLIGDTVTMIATVEMMIIATTDGNPTLKRTHVDAMTLAQDSLTEGEALASLTVNPVSIYTR